MIRIESLGTFAVTINGTPIRRWRAGKARALFQYLLLNKGRTVPRETLTQVLWPDADNASLSLKVAVHALRQILATASPSTSDGSSLELLSRDIGYVLCAQDVWIDFEEFEACVQAARQHELTGRADQARERYRQAIDLYRGDFMAGEPVPWIEERRQAHRDLALQSLRALAQAAMELDDYASVIRWSQRALEIEPYSEAVYQLLMYCHGRLGQPGRVKSWYDLCARKLREDLGVEPDQVTRELLATALSVGSGDNGGHGPALGSRRDAGVG